MATQSQVAEHLDLNQSTVSKLKDKGVLPDRAKPGGFDLDACRLAYIRHLRTGAAGRDSTKPGSLEAERARLASAQAEAIERKNAIERGDLASRPDMTNAYAGVIEIAVSRLQRVGAQVANQDWKLRKRIEDALNDVLSDLAKTPIDLALADQDDDREEGE
ncbi:hypothetical protein [Sphingobium sp. KCTC 72723]|uniref:hypothetical protein n=1 Tax=Sphingobium sp. KCTC 72723 TaxID=2733867 RepID=UPI00165D848D|nr:hypothetical protein [Sphingobium sp. KCTC 72723]